MKKSTLLLTALSLCILLHAQRSPAYLNPSLPLETRVNDLISKLTLEEKIKQMNYSSPAVEQLHIPAYNWWNEALHGVGRSGVATVFPQAIGLAATFNDSLAKAVATAISDEARAMYNAAIRKDYRMQYGGLTFWTPNINIFRDPRWGRGQETYGEDPFLTSRIGVAFVKGLQGDDPRYLKVAACAKHYAVHSGPEKTRHEFNAQVSMKDLWETYLPAFKALVDVKVEAVMCAYNRTNDAVCCGNTYLLKNVLRDQWNFRGHVVSDCWALSDFYQGHKIVTGAVPAALLALNSGVNLECGSTFPALLEAVKQGLVTEKKIDSSLAILLRTRFRLGMFDPPQSNPYNKIPETVINSQANRDLARKTAQQSIVLLKNNGVLPLRNDLPKYFVTGPNATSIEALLGNYYGINNQFVTVLEGIAGQVKPGSQLLYRQGILLDRPNAIDADWTSGEAKNADATIVVMGINGQLEGEEGETIASPFNGDRLDYNIPEHQVNFLRKLKAGHNKPVIAVITGGSPMNLAEVHELADAVLLAWYPGEEGGNAVADLIFGKVSPSGKLPVTFPKSLDQLPAYEDYSMKGRTYRYMTAEPMYPFGYGLSYTTFNYSNLKLSSSVTDKTKTITATVTIQNTGSLAADEVAQLYLTTENAGANMPLYSLKGFKRIRIRAGATAIISFTLTPEMLMQVNESGQRQLLPGKIKIQIGGALPGKRSETLGAPKPVEAMLTVR
ncbi:glycoside hydrolase family 3 C-terminal domain-containing protein [Sediminibacterium ginsengisoli]|uniref:Beta-glucosidase n=1 Tax=Sediminibacterium ginsengisoli TaxID=413434 RepID=A0A1T4RHU2_9BACT|nr:glycoside hydrolase family 3 C-terminal domain-containing protein [Sediminibacterium ginsengisoli]SKA15503.1 beta-glucosidase [Sediminibacterium ginsengisoli]